MTFLIFAGTVSLIFGLLSFSPPERVQQLSAKVDRTIVDFQEKFYDLRVGVGISLILISFLAFFTVYFLKRKYGI